MLGNLSGWHLVILVAVVLLLFGAAKLPALARSMGQSMRIFRSEVKTMQEESGDDALDGVVNAKPGTERATNRAPLEP